MAVMRVNKNKNYTVMSNYHLRDKNLSLKAKGLLSLMLSLPDDWDYSIVGLVAISKENESAIKSTLQELKEYNYLVVTKLYPNETDSGRLEYIYDIYEKPIQDLEKQDIEKQEVENQPLENQVQLNTKEINTKELNTNNNIYAENKKFSKPSLEEVSDYCKERNNNVDAGRFIDYYNANGWKVGKNAMKDWKACIRLWERNKESAKTPVEKKTRITKFDI